MKKILVSYTGILCFCFFLALTSCSRDTRVPVSGIITLNGEPLPKAYVTLVPMDQSVLNTRTGCITDQNGSFSLPKSRGLDPGEYSVSIYATVEYDGKTKELATVETPPPRIVRKVLTPPEYNDKSTLRFSVSTKGPNVFECDVKSNVSRSF